MLAGWGTRWQVLGLDFRGHGDSEWTPGAYLVTDYVADVVELLAREFDEPAVIVGHSLGAMVAAAVAAQAPGMVRGIVLEDPPFETMGSRIAQTPLLGYFRDVQRLLTARPNVSELTRQLAELRLTAPGTNVAHRLGDLRDLTQLRLGAAGLLRMDPSVLEPIVEQRWLAGYDLRGVLSAIRCPMLLLQGDVTLGGMLTDADADLAEELVGECLRIRCGRVGHLIHWSDAAGMDRWTTGFLESLRTQDAAAEVDVP